jgi:hypothetical protein
MKGREGIYFVLEVGGLLSVSWNYLSSLPTPVQARLAPFFWLFHVTHIHRRTVPGLCQEVLWDKNEKQDNFCS